MNIQFNSLIRTPVVDQAGMLTAEAQRYFAMLFQGVGGATLYGSRTSRQAIASAADGAVWNEVDTGLVYQFQGGAWTYQSGAYALNQPDIAALQAKLTAADTNMLIYVQDFDHRLQWNGVKFQRAPLDDRPGYVKGFEIDPDPITGWALCDGSATTVLNPDGSVAIAITPDLMTRYAVMKLGPVASLDHVNPPQPATFTGEVYTPQGAIPPFTPSGVVGAISQTGSGAIVVAPAGATQVAQETHTHPSPTFTGNLITAVFNGVPHLIAGTNAPDADLQNVTQRPWYRR